MIKSFVQKRITINLLNAATTDALTTSVLSNNPFTTHTTMLPDSVISLIQVSLFHTVCYLH